MKKKGEKELNKKKGGGGEEGKKVIRIDSGGKIKFCAGVADARMPARRDLKWTTMRVLHHIEQDRLDMHLFSFCRLARKVPAIRMGLFNSASHQNIKVSVIFREKIATTPAHTHTQKKGIRTQRTTRHNGSTSRSVAVLSVAAESSLWY